MDRNLTFDARISGMLCADVTLPYILKILLKSFLYIGKRDISAKATELRLLPALALLLIPANLVFLALTDHLGIAGLLQDSATLLVCHVHFRFFSCPLLTFAVPRGNASPLLRDITDPESRQDAHFDFSPAFVAAMHCWALAADEIALRAHTKAAGIRWRERIKHDRSTRGVPGCDAAYPT